MRQCVRRFASIAAIPLHVRLCADQLISERATSIRTRQPRAELHCCPAARLETMFVPLLTERFSLVLFLDHRTARDRDFELLRTQQFQMQQLQMQQPRMQHR